jgi:hypothetical protein
VKRGCPETRLVVAGRVGWILNIATVIVAEPETRRGYNIALCLNRQPGNVEAPQIRIRKHRV